MSKTSSGLEFGTKFVKEVTITQENNNLKIDNVFSLPLNKADSINLLTTGHVYTALKGKGSTFRFLEFPFTNRRKINQILPMELEEIIPFSLDNVIYQYQFLEKKKKLSKLLVSIVDKTGVEEINNFLNDRDFKVKQIMIEPVALANLFQFFPENENIGIVEIGKSHSSVVFRDNSTLFPKYINIGGEALIKEISNINKIPDEEAEELIISGNINNTLSKNFLNLLFIELRQFVFHFRDQTGNDIKKLYLTGGFSQLKGAKEFLEKGLDIEIEILSLPVFINNVPDGFIEQQFHLPLALALNGEKSRFKSSMDFSLFHINQTEELDEIRKNSFLTLLLLIILLILMDIYSFTNYKNSYNKYRDIKSQELELISKVMPNEKAIYDPVETMKSKLDRLKETVNIKTGNTNLTIIDLLNSISKEADSSIKTTIYQLSYENGTIRIKGEIGSYEDLDKLRTVWNGLDFFKSVDIVDSKKRGKTGQISFTMIIKTKEG